MKNKILTLVIGILIGAILTSGGLWIYFKNTVPEGGNPQMMNGEEPPAKPDGEEEPPEMPSDDNMTSNTPVMQNEVE